jgi:predicted dehydrogenase
MATYKALLVGAGSWGKEWAKTLVACPDVELVGWVSRRAGVVAAAATELGLPRLHTGEELRAALERVRPDFVIDATPPEVHHTVTLEALGFGVPVLGEKPMAHTMEHARAMVKASERAQQLYMVSQSRRYNPQLRATQTLARQRLGALGILNSDFYIGAHFGGFRDQMPSPLLLDMAIHTFDAARYLTQADPVSVYAEEFNPPWSWYQGAASATVIFEMTGGLRYTYRGSWCAEGAHTSWESEWRIVGELGSLRWDGANRPSVELVRERGGFHSRTEQLQVEAEAMDYQGIAGALRDFLRALGTGEPPMGECHDNIKSLAMVFGALESSARRQRVTLSE